jgi:hypothetical protein
VGRETVNGSAVRESEAGAATQEAEPGADVRAPEASARRKAVAWRLAPVGLAILAGILFLWNLTVSGWANTYYAAAAQAGSQSRSAPFYGAIDAGGFITVDKPPVSLWVQGLSVRLLGLCPLAVLLPQALAGVAALAQLHGYVRDGRLRYVLLGEGRGGGPGGFFGGDGQGSVAGGRSGWVTSACTRSMGSR